MEREVLLLNTSEEVLQVIDWRKAISLLFTGKAVPPYNYQHAYTIRGATQDYSLPAAIVLVRYVRIPHRNISPSKRNVLRRDNYECQYCGIRLSNTVKRTVDHVVPMSKRGTSSWTNMVASCHRCNNKKGSNTPEESGLKLRRKPTIPKHGLLYLIGMSQTNKILWRRWLDV
mgnify:CR=1 FL=1